MKFNLTTSHIAEGQPWNCYHCPVSACIKESLPCTEVSVNRMNIHITPYPGNVGPVRKYQIIPTPDAVGRFIRQFDEGDRDAVQPFEFDLPVETVEGMV